ncbi:bifunctional phosphoribosyl-AMP cyclohydrolase/phosphoribosyl-ATP diphosphatase HisIE [Sutterella sp.]|uniref:bifunctional phosphoribosyl-AMP cyclohydrolase/phosphoribosyl-ATP diphosphatase HisIE n=1 Tax=Sutterella sp. TaxID=1981025 RepID=UPI0026DF5485|nr:bifunctional phosphoribosyl-AMP cyclohydrolase/phosphoribosyl-ATP diphosphatase HisIE [Sutterella sp.]MDO5531220.1 bifunctional phosphoribosyl-AMP cyclohydrolase/phosphoribosyl-ATP diphosphatase HisIE [Sutterella sp.]
MEQIDSLDWEKTGGMMPAIIEDATSGQVLMLGYMNRDALEVTLTTKKVTFFSRTKNRLWTKGETSGNWLNLVDIGTDCDSDTLLVLVNAEGPTCHTGSQSCFGPLEAKWQFLRDLEVLLGSRKNADPASSYTASLYARGTKRIAQKVGEEGVETALAATVHDSEELKNEAADLVYHLLVLLQDANLELADVIGILRDRHSAREAKK